MTKNRDIVADLGRAIADRAQIWTQYDEVRQKTEQLTQYRQFERVNTTETIAALSPQKTPPDEIAATLWELKNESEAIASAERQIQACQTSIQQAKNQSLAVIGGAVGLIVIVIIVIASQ